MTSCERLASCGCRIGFRVAERYFGSTVTEPYLFGDVIMTQATIHGHIKSTDATLSVVVITLNEEENLRDCLESVRWADEIVVVDAESSDQTVRIARQNRARVFVRPWQGFGAQKNFGMDQVLSEWILILDADERVSAELRREIQELLKRGLNQAVCAYRVPRRNFYYGRWVRWGGVYPDYQVRLVRKGKGRYNNVRIHENLIVDGSVGTLDGHLDHYTERQIADHFKRFGLYTTYAATQLRESRQVVRWYDFLGRSLVTMFKTYVVKQGVRDGTHGLIISVLASMYTFVKYAKLWELLYLSSDKLPE